MQVCGLSRIAIPAMIVGIVVSTFTGSELLGWLGATVAGVGVIAFQRIRGRGATCTALVHTTQGSDVFGSPSVGSPEPVEVAG